MAMLVKVLSVVQCYDAGINVVHGDPKIHYACMRVVDTRSYVREITTRDIYTNAGDEIMIEKSKQQKYKAVMYDVVKNHTQERVIKYFVQQKSI